MNALFATFDVFPSPKGAGTHIAQTALALAERFDRVHLVTLGHADMPAYQREGAITLHRCLAGHPNLLRRSDYFGDHVHSVVSRLDIAPRYVHFRDIWSGLPLLTHERLAGATFVFEVNGLPSVELPCHYPALAKNASLIKSIRAMEDYCLAHAHGIIAVCETGRRYLVSRGVPAGSITVLPNMAADPGPDAASPDDPRRPAGDYILYAGTAAPWQGLPLLLRALRLIRSECRATLVLAISTRKHLKAVRRLVRRMGLADRVRVHVGLSRERLFALYRDARFSLAPLSRCDRNELQGCSPIKILESMACGTPVIAARLPVCAEIVTHGRDGYLFTPDSARSLANAMRALLGDPGLCARLGAAAEDTIRTRHSAAAWSARLLDACESYMNTQRKEAYHDDGNETARHRRDHQETAACRRLEL